MCMETVYLLLFSTSLVAGHLFVDGTGRQELTVIENQPVRLPNITEIEDTLGTINVIQELRWLRAEVQSLQQELQTMNSTLTTVQNAIPTPIPGCDWQGVYCHCFLEDSVDHAVILIGSYCNNSTLEWVRVIDMHIDVQIFVCAAVVNLSTCDGFF